jgi:hypothetical protein
MNRKLVIRIVLGVFALLLLAASHGYAYYRGWVRGGYYVVQRDIVGSLQDTVSWLQLIEKNPALVPKERLLLLRVRLRNGIVFVESGVLPEQRKSRDQKALARTEQVLTAAKDLENRLTGNPAIPQI